MIEILLIGDYSDSVLAHQAIPKALALSALTLGQEARWTWRDTDALECDDLSKLEMYQGFWCVPGSPYRSMDGALKAIRFARERGRSFLGTCGGFQHALIEYARSEIALTEADHRESNPKTSVPVIERLACSLAESKGVIHLKPGSQAASAYGAETCEEAYHCNYGFNGKYREALEAKGLRFTGFDPAGEPRIFELPQHRFYIGALFQPERRALSGREHPLITAFVKSATGMEMYTNRTISN